MSELSNDSVRYHREVVSAKADIAADHIDLEHYDAACEERSYGDSFVPDQEIEIGFEAAAIACRRHSRHSHDCFMPIMDEEGNPGYKSEACATGAMLLTVYNKREAQMFALLERRRETGK